MTASSGPARRPGQCGWRVFGVADVDVIRPEESIVLVPFRQGLPIVRLDLPTTARDQDKAWDAVSGPYGRHARPGAVLAVLCFTEDRRSAEHASQHMSNRLDGLGINTHLRLWTDGKRWREFNTGHGGLRNQTTAERIATTTVLAGAPQAFHVRLTGPADRRLARAIAIDDATIEQARARQADTDKAWSRFVSRLFDKDPADPSLYHVVLDTTVLTWDACVDLLASAANAFWSSAATA